MALRPTLFALHRYLGLVAGLFLLLLGGTGSIMAFEPELLRLTHPHRSYVTPVPPARSLAELGAIVQSAFPGDTIAGYFRATAPGFSEVVALTDKNVYVNQYTGAILEVELPSTPFLAKVHQLHTHLLLDVPRGLGKAIMAWAGLFLLLLLISGLYLWWPTKRVRIEWQRGGRRRWFDVHNVSGVISFVFLLVLAASGCVIGFESTTTRFFNRITASTPVRPPDLKVATATSGPAITPDRAMAIADSALPGARAFALDVSRPGRPYDVRLHFPEDRTPGGRSRVLLDPASGKVLWVTSSRTAPVGTQLVTLNRAIHTGDLFGMPTKILMSLASLMAVVQVVSGVLMWGNRRRG